MADIYQLEFPIPESLENLQLPDPSLLNDYLLDNERIIYIDYEIDMSIINVQKRIILFNLEDKNVPIEKREPIKLLLDCPGGLLSETMSLIATIEMSKTPIWTINMADAYSGGSMILISGHRRFAMPYSKALIHTGSGGMGGTHEQVMAQSKKYEKEVKVMGDFIVNHTKIDSKTYNKKKKDEGYLTDKEQLEYGLVDEIVGNIFDLLEE